MNVRVDLNYPIKDGTEVVFRSPVDCSQVTGLKVYYPGESGNTESKEFAFADAHGNNVGDIDHLFAENVAVKVILDVTTSMAFVQNADTNAYLEGRFAGIEAMVDKLCPAFTESGAVVTCEPVEGYPLTVTAENGATITRCGKNLINPTAYINASTSPSTLEGDVFTSNFTNGALYINSHKKVKHPKGTYTATFFPVTEGAVCSFFVYSAATGALLTSKYDVKAEKPSLTFTVEEDFYFAVGGSKPYGMQSYRLQLEAGSKSTGYAPYQGNTFAAGEQIPVLPGINTLWADSGEITVSGKADPVARLERLESAILAMGANV